MKVDVEGLEVNALIGLEVSKDGSCRPNAIAIEDWLMQILFVLMITNMSSVVVRRKEN